MPDQHWDTDEIVVRSAPRWAWDIIDEVMACAPVPYADMARALEAVTELSKETA